MSILDLSFDDFESMMMEEDVKEYSVSNFSDVDDQT